MLVFTLNMLCLSSLITAQRLLRFPSPVKQIRAATELCILLSVGLGECQRWG